MHKPSLRLSTSAIRGSLLGATALLAVGLMVGQSGCNLISVAMLVGKKYAPALGKGDKRKLKEHSTRRLAGYWDAFTEKEIKAAVSGGAGGNLGKKGGAAKGQRRVKSVSTKLVSFKVKGKRAVLVARRGKMKFSFICLQEGGRWKVDDINFPQGGKTRHLSRMLKLLLAAKTMQRGLETGSRYLLANVSTPGFRKRTWDQLTDAELAAIGSTAQKSLGGSKRTRKKKGPRITSEITQGGAKVFLTRTALPITIRLVEQDGHYWIDDVQMKLGGHWHGLGEIVGYLAPALGLLRWGQRHVLAAKGPVQPTPRQLAGLVSGLQGVLSRALWRRSFSWLTPKDLQLLPWTAIRRALQPAPPVAGAQPPTEPAPPLGPSAITQFKRTGDRLALGLKLPQGRLALEMVLEAGNWRVQAATLKYKERTFSLGDLLAALSPMVRLTAQAARLGPTILQGTPQSNEALDQLLTELKRVSSTSLNAQLWSRIPRSLLKNIPLDALPGALQALLPKTPSGAAPSTSPPGAAPTALPKIELVRVDQKADRLTLAFTVAAQPVQLHLIRERSGWKLDDVFAPVAGKRRSLKRVLGMLAPAAALGDAVLSGNGRALEDAVDADLNHRVIGPLLKILGKRFKKLVASLRPKKQKGATPKTTPPKAAPATAAGGGFKLRSLTFGPGPRQATIALSFGPKLDVIISLVQDNTEVWRIHDVSFPLAGRTLTLRRAGPILVPLLGFGISLMTGDLRGVRLSSSRAFNRSVWRRITKRKFRGLLKQLMPKKKATRRRRAGRNASAQDPRPKLISLRIKDRVRYPWAQVVVSLGGRRISASLTGYGGNWKVHDVSLNIGGLSLSIKKLLAMSF